MRIALFFIISVLLFPALGLTVVADSGHTVSAFAYVGKPATQPKLPETKAMTLAPLMAPEKNAFVLGAVKAHPIALKIAQPFFIIGDDATSLRWLAANAKTLTALHALGFIAELQPGDTVQRLQAKTSLPLTVCDLKGLRERIGTNHYPVLIAKGQVMQ